MQIDEFVSSGMVEGWLQKTDNINDVYLGGKNTPQRVYEVRVDRLRYNVQNGRIATFLTRYLADHGELPEDSAERNDVIQKMIEDDNPQALAKTRLDIKVKGQQEPAIILTNGVVIDGNRRFTCLRQLSREEATPRFLRCYIFPDTYDAKAIKLLELDVQLGKDEKRDYDAISLLVDIKRSVQSGLVTKEEYARHANLKPNQMRSMLAQIDLIDEFLDYIGAPGEYHIAQDLHVQDPMRSLASKLGKCRNEDEKDDLKNVLFTQLLLLGEGDRARDVRKTMDEFLDSYRRGGTYAEEQLDLAESVLEKIDGRAGEAPVTTGFIRDELMGDDVLQDRMRVSQAKERLKNGNAKVKADQVESVTDALERLGDVNPDLFAKLASAQLQEMRDGLDELREASARLAAQVAEALAARDGMAGNAGRA